MFLQKQVLAAVLLLLAPAHRLVVEGSGSAHFSYDQTSEEGPEHWKDLMYDDGTVNECGGRFNSPIAIEVAEECEWFANYEFIPGDCTIGDFGFQVSDHAEQINAPGPEVCTTNIMRVPGQDFTFEMSQFHIHVSSEHTLGGKVFGAELHAVHKARETDNLFAVLGFFIEPTATKNHPIFDQLLHELDEHADEIGAECNRPSPLHWWQKERPDMKRMRANNRTYDHETLNVYDLIPEGSSFYNYDGGLTTPPCTEAVVWNVVDTPIAISPVQYTDLVALIVNHVDEHSCDYSTIADPFSGSTSRPTQPLNRRRVERICPEPVEEADNGKNDKNADDGEINVDDEEAAVVSRTGGDW